MKAEPEKCRLYLGSGRSCARPLGHTGRHSSEPNLNGLWKYLDDIEEKRKTAP